MTKRIAALASILLTSLGLTVLAYGEDLNYIGSMSLLVTAPERVSRTQMLSFRFSGMGRKPSLSYGFGAETVTLSHDYADITQAQAATLSENMIAWYYNPHSSELLSGPTSLSVIGSAYLYTPETVPSVIFNVYTWEGSNPHHHGGSYMVLNGEEVLELGQKIGEWAARPSQGHVYQRLVY